MKLFKFRYWKFLKPDQSEKGGVWQTPFTKIVLHGNEVTVCKRLLPFDFEWYGWTVKKTWKYPKRSMAISLVCRLIDGKKPVLR